MNRVTVVCESCNNSNHQSCNGKAVIGISDIRQCDCSCRKPMQRTFMKCPYLVMASLSACISAGSIKDRLGKLDKDTDLAVEIRNSHDCRQVVKPALCGIAMACLSRSLFAASSCKSANDAAASSQPADVQYANDKACKSDLELAESFCKQMKDYANADIRLPSGSEDGSHNELSDMARNPSDASQPVKAHD